MESQKKASKDAVKQVKRLSLNKETLRRLDENTELDGVSGGTSSSETISACGSVVAQ